MAFDVKTAERQIDRISQQIETVHELRKSMVDYRKRLNGVWVAKEMNYINQAIDSMTDRCSQLERQLERLERDMARAVEDILEEEAERDAAAAKLLL